MMQELIFQTDTRLIRFITKLSATMVLLMIIYDVTQAADLEKNQRDRPCSPEEKAVALSMPGLSNFYRVTKNFYRGAQPTAQGFRELKAIGIRTVINLRSFHSDRKKIGLTGLAYEHIYMKAWHPEPEEIIRFLQIVTDHHRTPVFVHCMHGADRTGIMTAVYRIAVCEWTKKEAIAEMTDQRFGFHKMWKNIISFMENLDVQNIMKTYLEPADNEGER